MEGNVWNQLSALVAAIASLLSNSLTAIQKQTSPTSSPNVPATPASSSSTLKTTQENQCLRITRNPSRATVDATFGDMDYNGDRICFTMERTAVAIPEGTYSGVKRYSPHFGKTVVGISVPNRTDIEVHPANYPCQLEGCIAVGESIDGDALDNSTTEFDAMMKVVPQEFTVEVMSS